MTTRAEGELLTRVGPGTPMGNFMREYWIPAALSCEFTANGPPTRLMLLGEQLIAFRDAQGPGRCARPSLPAPVCLPVLRPQRQ